MTMGQKSVPKMGRYMEPRAETCGFILTHAHMAQTGNRGWPRGIEIGIWPSAQSLLRATCRANMLMIIRSGSRDVAERRILAGSGRLAFLMQRTSSRVATAAGPSCL